MGSTLMMQQLIWGWPCGSDIDVLKVGNGYYVKARTMQTEPKGH